MKEKRTKIVVGVISLLFAIALLVIVFFAGYWTRGITDARSLDWVLSVIDEFYYKEVDIDDSDELASDAVVAKYLDEYSAFYTAEEYAQLQLSNSGSKSGFGVTTSYLYGRGILLRSVIGNSPAFDSGLRSGDILVGGEYGGQSVSFESAAQFSDFIDGVADGEVTFITATGKRCTLARAEYTQSYVLFATNDSAWTFAGQNADIMQELPSDGISYLPEGAAYLCVSQFYGGVSEQFGAAVEKFNALGCTSLIIDLRNNGGGYIDDMQELAGYFEDCHTGTVAATAKYRSGATSDFPVIRSSENPSVSGDADVYILANCYSASASEALIGCLISYGVLDYQDIYISQFSQEYLQNNGTDTDYAKNGKTFGKGIMQSTFVNNATGAALKLTTAQIYWPNGVTIHGKGLSSAEGCQNVPAPFPVCGDGEELFSAVQMIFA